MKSLLQLLRLQALLWVHELSSLAERVSWIHSSASGNCDMQVAGQGMRLGSSCQASAPGACAKEVRPHTQGCTRLDFWWAVPSMTLLCSTQVRPYQEDEVVLIVGAQHRFASRTHIDKDELLGLSFVSLHRSSTVQGIKNTLVGNGVDWKALKVVMVRLLALTEPLRLTKISTL